MKLVVNGAPREVDAPADTPLLWVLRDHLDLTGTKFGCGIGQCGACTVHVDGEATRSCQLALGAVGERSVTTIEGLGANGLHALQRAWLEEQVVQCGYCQPGQLMQASALLAVLKDPTDDQIREGMQGVLCRCGTYPRICRAIARAAKAER